MSGRLHTAADLLSWIQAPGFSLNKKQLGPQSRCCASRAGLMARSQYPEGPATGHLDTGFSWFPCA